MRFMMLLKADATTESGALPDESLLTAMNNYNEELVSAGALLAGEGLHPTSAGARVRFSSGEATVTPGPFAVEEGLIAGFWLIKVASLDAAIAWVKRAPLDGGAEIELLPAIAISSRRGLPWCRSPTLAQETGVPMKIKLNSIIVQDQGKALAFYTEVLGFVKVLDFPVGEFRWITVASPEEPDGTQLVLEPNANPAAKVYQAALHDQGVPLTAFAVDDIQAEYERLTDLGVRFTMEPNDQGMVVFAVFDDTCGNLIQIYQVK